MLTMNNLTHTLVFDFSLKMTFLSKWFLRGISLNLLLLFYQIVNAQDPVFSQFYLSPLQLNPGLAGLTEDPRFSANYTTNSQVLIMPTGHMLCPMTNISPMPI